jgi:hypothetical protein
MPRESMAVAMVRLYLEQKLPEIIGTVAHQIIRWIESASAFDVERIADELDPREAQVFRRMVAAAKGES